MKQEKGQHQERWPRNVLDGKSHTYRDADAAKELDFGILILIPKHGCSADSAWKRKKRSEKGAETDGIAQDRPGRYF